MLAPHQEKIIKYIMGEVMKATKGKADPVILRRVIIDILSTYPLDYARSKANS